MWKNRKLDDLKQAGVSEKTGFPNAATDTSLTSLNLAKLLIKNPSSTFFMRLRGEHWQDRGIFDGDVIVVDRALEPRPADLVVWVEDDEFRISKLTSISEEAMVWGVVTAAIHKYRS